MMSVFHKPRKKSQSLAGLCAVLVRESYCAWRDRCRQTRCLLLYGYIQHETREHRYNCGCVLAVRLLLRTPLRAPLSSLFCYSNIDTPVRDVTRRLYHHRFLISLKQTTPLLSARNRQQTKIHTLDECVGGNHIIFLLFVRPFPFKKSEFGLSQRGRH